MTEAKGKESLEAQLASLQAAMERNDRLIEDMQEKSNRRIEDMQIKAQAQGKALSELQADFQAQAKTGH